MTKPNRKTVCTAGIVVALIIFAYLCRLPGFNRYAPRFMDMARSVIYLGLYTAWGFSVRNRIIQKQVCRYMMSIAFLMVFWFLVRTIRYYFVSGILYPDVKRYLWYLYYFPMILIPLLAVFVALSIGRPEYYHLPGTVKLLYGAALGLFLMVITNDLHQMVFMFPVDAAVWNASDYGYAFIYYLIVVWLVFCALALLVIMYRKRRVSGSRRLILIPCIPILMMMMYMGFYYSGVEWLRIVSGDMTATTCLLYAATIESCIQCGFIQANTHYRELFDASTVGVLITDEEYRVFLSSKAAKTVDTEILCRTKDGPVMLEGGLRLSGASVHGGHVIWSEDTSALTRVLNELKEAKENLEDSNALLEEENALRAREAHIAEEERLYNMIQKDTARQIRLMDELIDQVESSGTEEERVRLLGKMLVIGIYLKRRSNLVFLEAKTPVLEAKELDLTFRESMDNLELYGVVCGFRSELTEPLEAVYIMAMYDFFEEITECSFDCMSSLTVCISKTGDNLCITVNTDSSADFSQSAVCSPAVGDSGVCDLGYRSSGTVTAVQDDDGEWQLTLSLRTGKKAENTR